MLPSLFLRLSIDTDFKYEILPVRFKDTLHYGNNRSPSVDNVSVRKKTEPIRNCVPIRNCTPFPPPEANPLKRERPSIPRPNTEGLLTCTLSGTTDRTNPDVWRALATDLASYISDDIFFAAVTVQVDLRVEVSFMDVANLLYTFGEDPSDQINNTLTFSGDFLTERRDGLIFQLKLFDKVCRCSSVPSNRPYLTKLIRSVYSQRLVSNGALYRSVYRTLPTPPPRYSLHRTEKCSTLASRRASTKGGRFGKKILRLFL